MGQAAVNYHDFITPTYNIGSREKVILNFKSPISKPLKYYLFISRRPAIVYSIKKNIKKILQGNHS